MPGEDATSRPSCGIIRTVDTEERPSHFRQGNVKHLTSGRLVGLQGRLTRPYWALMGGWATLCGALASHHLRWEGEALLTLALVYLLADLAWGSLWDLATGTNWFRLLAEDWSPVVPALLPVLPYTQPGSPGGRISRRLNRFLDWWRQVFWPTAGPSLVGLLASGVLAIVLSLLLPDRLRPLNAALVALIGLGMVQRRHDREPLAGQALVGVGLSWLAGHLAFSDMTGEALALALCFPITACGVLRLAEGRPAGNWLVNSGLVAGVALMVVMRQPLAAGVLGLLFFGTVALQVSLGSAGDCGRAVLSNRTWPWLMLSMLVAAWTLP
jgi:hypothetical protein